MSARPANELATSPPGVLALITAPAEAFLEASASAQYLDLDTRIDANEHDAVWARWEFGRLLLAERRANGGKQLPHGRLSELCALVGKSERELRYRMTFAQRYPTKAKVGNALQIFGSWHRIVESFSAVHSVMSSTTYESYTPTQYVDAARKILGAIDLDPASCAEANRTVRAKRFLTVEDDGLRQEWSGRVWMNPPYSRNTTGPFVTKLVEAFDAGRVSAAILLLNAYGFDAEWFQPLFEHLLCFTDHRIKFFGASPSFGNVFVYLGPEHDHFIEVFSEFGAVVGRAKVQKSPPSRKKKRA